MTPAQMRVMQGYLLNVAKTLALEWVPAIEPATQARARDCITVLLRVAESLNAGDSSPVSGAVPDEISAESNEQTVRAQLLLLAAAETRVSQLNAAVYNSATTGREFKRDWLEAYLRKHAAGGSALRIQSAKTLPGGRSKLTVLIEQAGAAALPARFVLRQDWGAGGVQGTTVVTEFELLKFLAGARLNVPMPLLLEPALEPLGAPFMLVTLMHGSSQGNYFDPSASATLALQMAEQLGRLHGLPIPAFAQATLRTEATTPTQLREGLAVYRRLHEQMGIAAPVIDIALRWLEANADRVQGRVSLLHNDLGSHNLLIDGNRLIAILDWELASIGNPGADLGYARNWLTKLLPWDQFMNSYHAAGGPPIDAVTLDFYTLWSELRLYTMLLQARAGIAAGAIHDLEVTSICADSTPRLLGNMGGDLARILRVASKN